MKFKLLFLISIFLTFGHVKLQIEEIRGDLSSSVSESMKYSSIKDIKLLLDLRNAYFLFWDELINHLTDPSQLLTFAANFNITEIKDEVVKHKKGCVKHMGMDKYLSWYNKLRIIMEKSNVPKINEAIETFLKTLTGKKVVRCWLAGKDAAKQCLQYEIAQHAYKNTTSTMIQSYISYRDKISKLNEDAKKNINKTNSASFFISTNQENMWGILKGFNSTVEKFSNTQEEATSEILTKTFTLMLPKCEAIFKSITECVNTKVTKAPKATTAAPAG